MEHKNRFEQRMERKFEKGMTKVVKITFAVIFGIIMAFLVGYIVMRLWNWLMPDLFGLGMIGYWQAVGILILAKLFFGFGHCDSGGRKHKNKFNRKKCDPIRKDFAEWDHYDDFWKEEGEAAFKDYIKRNKKEE